MWKFWLVPFIGVMWQLSVAHAATQTLSSTTLEKREMPAGLVGPGIGAGPYSPGPMYGGGGGGGGGYGAEQQYGGGGYGYAPQAYGSGDMTAAATTGGGQGPPPPYPPFGYKDPGFSVQTGFEGFLVPNSWYGLLPWGIEGVVIVIVGIIVAMVIVVSIVALLVWLTGFGDFALVKEQARNYIPSSLPSREYLNELSETVLKTIDRYNELVKEK